MVLEDCDMVTSKQIKQMPRLVYTCTTMLSFHVANEKAQHRERRAQFVFGREGNFLESFCSLCVPQYVPNSTTLKSYMLCAKFSPFSPTKDRWVKGEALHPPIEMRGQSFFTFILENLQSLMFLVLWANQNGSLHTQKKKNKQTKTKTKTWEAPHI